MQNITILNYFLGKCLNLSLGVLLLFNQLVKLVSCCRCSTFKKHFMKHAKAWTWVNFQHAHSYYTVLCNALQILLICLFLLHNNVLLVLFENLQVQATFWGLTKFKSTTSHTESEVGIFLHPSFHRLWPIEEKISHDLTFFQLMFFLCDTLP